MEGISVLSPHRDYLLLIDRPCMHEEQKEDGLNTKKMETVGASNQD